MTGLSARGQQVDEADEVAQLLYVRLQREDLFAVLTWLVHDAGSVRICSRSSRGWSMMPASLL